MALESKIITIKAKPAEGQIEYRDPVSESYKQIAAQERASRFFALM